MTKEKKDRAEAAAVESAPVPAQPASVTQLKPPTPPTPPTAPSIPAPQEKLADVDKLQLDLAKARRETALAQAKEALAKNETADLNYKYVILQLYMKYGMSQADALSENGDIVRGGAAAYQAQQQGK